MSASQPIYNFETRQILCLNDNHLAETSVLSDTQSQSFNVEQSNVSVSHPDVISCDVLHSGFCSCEIWKAWNLTEIFHQRSSIEIPVGGQHNITQQISRKCVVDEKFVKVLTSPQTVSISWRSLEAHQRLSWISLRRSCSKVSIVICVQTSANLQDNILIFRNWVAKHWPAPKHPVRHIDLWSLAPRLEIWTPGLRSLSSSWRASC